VVDGVAPPHDGAWAKSTLEVCLAILRSAREERDIALPLDRQAVTLPLKTP
jgi:phthalate 4,5-cis-dihydrodiol dehydrogenase